MSGNVQTFFRIAYGFLLLGTLLLSLPQGRRFFLSERWGGYSQSSPSIDRIQNPYVLPFVMMVWLACSVGIIFGRQVVASALFNLLLCHYFFIRMRWRNIARGLGAPGFMTYWLGAALFLLEYCSHYAPELHPLALLVLQADLALIILSSGTYKFFAGYRRNEGMEYGLVNPEWGYWWRFYSKLSPKHGLFKWFNHSAWSSQVLGGILMLIPATRLLGALMMIASFAFVRSQIRLGFLCEMMILSGVFYFCPGSLPDRWISLMVPEATHPTMIVSGWFPAVNMILGFFLWSYLFILPLAHAGLFYNFYGRKSLPRALQFLLEKYTNFFGMIIWRVFSVDLVNFFILVYQQPRTKKGDRKLISRYGWGGSLRYAHVAESITVTSLFTTLKYYPGHSELFRERLVRYARTVPCPKDEVLVFEYVSIRKTDHEFQFVPSAEYTVDLEAGTVSEQILDPTAEITKGHAASPIHEGVRPGSYVPAGV